MTEHIVVYGKGGVGSSTLISNISASLVEAGFRVMQIGCGLNGDSCSTLNGGLPISTVREQYVKHGAISFDTVVHRGFRGIYCMELGSPEAVQSASATATALDLLLEHDLISLLSPDFVFYDISGEQISILHALCEKVTLHRIFAVTTADFKSLTAVNALMFQLEHFADNNLLVPFGGLIANGISSSFEESFVGDFARQLGVRTLGRIPRSLLVRQCELYGKTVIEASPLSNQSYYYRRLANQIADEASVISARHQPHPLTTGELHRWAHEWADRLYAMENGLVNDGSAI